MIPAQQEEFAKSLIALSLFSANFYFWRDSDYFAASAEERPLLHTWSLAVEEQYYVFFPLFLLALVRRRERYLILAIAAVAVCSFLLCEFASRHYPRANFYLTPTRAWELLAGSLCAALHHRDGQKRNDLLSGIGLALIVAAILLYGSTTPFPSVYALAPVVGTTLIILYGPAGTITARFLSTPVLVGVGLISYSAYLWHQPLFVMARIRTLYDPPAWLMIILSGASLLLAAISWRFVEQPFRKRNKAPGSRAHVLGYSALVLIGFTAIGATGLSGQGLFFGVANDGRLAESLTRQAHPNYGLARDCDASPSNSTDCRTAEAPKIAVWGDSFAMHLVEGILASYPKAEIVQMTMERCGPFLDAAPYSASLGRPWSQSCLDFNTRVLEWLSKQESVEIVVLSSPYRAYVSEGWEVLRDGKIVPSSLELAAEMLEETLLAIESMGKKPVIISPTPQSGNNIGRCVATSIWVAGDVDACNFDVDELAEVSRNAASLLQRISSRWSVVWLHEGICSEGTCYASMDGNPIYLDNGHLTIDGARYLGRKMDFYRRITE
jgi:peptidoglycan/LPS O-acetylase OafA/YrhL